MKRTGGDWRVVDGTFVMAGDRVVADCGTWRDTAHPTASRLENIANARAIAALPRVAVLLRELLPDVGDPDDPEAFWSSVRTTITAEKHRRGEALLKELEGDDAA